MKLNEREMEKKVFRFSFFHLAGKIQDIVWLESNSSETFPIHPLNKTKIEF